MQLFPWRMMEVAVPPLTQDIDNAVFYYASMQAGTM